jgi:mono/diheme cytochrome c family protein
MSGNFQEDFQCDLIDFREKCVKDKHGNVMRWLMVLKDHFTCFVYMQPLPTKEAKGVCYELNIILSLIGFPEIYHSDNGGEVCAAEIIDMLTKGNPTINTVCSRPRKPSTQGLVKRANRSIKTMIASLEEEQKQKGEAKNWTECIGRAIGAINGARCHGKDVETPYYQVFGMPYYQPSKVPLSASRRATTVPAKALILESKSFNQRMDVLKEK